jgi:hypothetical protein
MHLHKGPAKEKTKPLAVMGYSLYKIGVDRPDQSLAYHSFQRKSNVVEKTVLPSL